MLIDCENKTVTAGFILGGVGEVAPKSSTGKKYTNIWKLLNG